MKFQILQYWADMIMYNSYMKEMKYVQVMNLGAFAKAKSVSQSLTFWYIREKHGFHFLMRKLWISIGRSRPPMKLIG